MQAVLVLLLLYLLYLVLTRGIPHRSHVPAQKRNRSSQTPRITVRGVVRLNPATHPGLAAFCENLEKKNDAYYVTRVESGREVAFGVTVGEEWINVIVGPSPTKKPASGDGLGGYRRYSFSMAQARWSYGESPKGMAMELRDLIKTKLGGPDFMGRF